MSPREITILRDELDRHLIMVEKAWAHDAAGWPARCRRILTSLEGNLKEAYAALQDPPDFIRAILRYGAAMEDRGQLSMCQDYEVRVRGSRGKRR